MKRLVVGLTGGVGSGKSTVAAFFRKRGAQVVDADAIGHRVLDRPALRARLVRAFGRGILRDDGRVDRAALGRAAFRSRRSIARLNRIVHPAISREMRRQTARRRWSVVDAALLYESGWDAMCDRVIFVRASRRVRERRVRASRGWSRAELARRERLQGSLREKEKRADYVVDNEGPVSRTRRRLESICQDVRRLL